MKKQSPKPTGAQLEQFLAEFLYCAQEHCGDPQAWSMDYAERSYRFECVSHAVSCFLAQHTAYGNEGVESNIVLDDLAHSLPPIKSTEIWTKILRRHVRNLGGWKQ